MRIINRVIYLTLALVVLAPLGLLPQVQAVSQTPEPRPTPTPRPRGRGMLGSWRQLLLTGS
jgi:hypothetical protein